MFVRRPACSEWLLAAVALIGIGCTQLHPAPLLPPPPANPPGSSAPAAIPIPAPPAEDSVPLDSLRWPTVQEETLPSGVTVRLIQTSGVPLVHLRIAMPVGRNADGDRPGVARLTAMTLLEGALGPDAPTRRTSGLEQLATPAVNVTADATVFAMTMTTSDVASAIDHLHGMFVRPGFRLSAFLRAQQDAPRVIAADRFVTGVQEALGGTFGAEDERMLAQIKAWNCRAFHAANYDPRRAVVVWVGDLSPAQARTFTERLVDGWKSPPPVKQPTPTTTTSTRRTAAELTPTKPGRVLIAAVASGPAWDDKDWPALWLVAQTMTKKCPALPWASPVGAFRICDTIASSDIDRWITGVESQLADVGEHGLASDTLEAAKRNLIQVEAQRLSRPDALADTLARWSASDVDAVGDRVRELNDVKGAVARHLRAEDLRYVVVPVDEN